jgi:hypothetical protein
MQRTLLPPPHAEAIGVWDAKFGNFSREAPVIITEWISAAYVYNADTLESTVQFIQYLQEHGIGV